MTKSKKGTPVNVDMDFGEMAFYGHLTEEESKEVFYKFLDEEGWYRTEEETNMKIFKFKFERLHKTWWRFVPLNPQASEEMGFKGIYFEAEPNRRGAFPVTLIMFREEENDRE